MGTRGYLNHLLYRRRKLRGSKQYQELTPLLTFASPSGCAQDPPVKPYGKDLACRSVLRVIQTAPRLQNENS